ncbi:unnamed protein product [Amoebophrya sp. A120]|nr:unnamed protein product [Amoebophrya sp. A120]|eukprot:GSA120T00010141001.1
MMLGQHSLDCLLSALIFFQVFVNAPLPALADSDDFATSFPHFPTRGVRTIDTWDFYFEDESKTTEENRAKKIQVSVPDAFDLPIVKVKTNSKCGLDDSRPVEDCCERALGRFGEETCYTLKNEEILKSAAQNLLSDEDEEEVEEAKNFENANKQDGGGPAVGTTRTSGASVTPTTPTSPPIYSDCCQPTTDFTHKRGFGVYETVLGGHITMLRFHSCVFYCEVYVDNFLMESFVSGYAVKDVFIGKFQLEKKRIKVRVSNQFDYDRTPIHQLKYDWYQAGGLVRPVEAHAGNFLLFRQAVVSPVWELVKKHYMAEDHDKAVANLAKSSGVNAGDSIDETGNESSSNGDHAAEVEQKQPPPPQPGMPQFHTSLSNALNLPSFPVLEEDYAVKKVQLDLFLEGTRFFKNLDALLATSSTSGGDRKFSNSLDIGNLPYEFQLRWEHRCGNTNIATAQIRGSKTNLPPGVVPSSSNSVIEIMDNLKTAEYLPDEDMVKLTFENLVAPGVGVQDDVGPQDDHSAVSAALWSLDQPNLHFASISLLDKEKNNELLDCIIIRFGLRKIEAKFSRFYLNGKTVKLKGYNRHDMDVSGTGPAMSLGTHYRDVRLIKTTLFANFIRGAHYPMDQRFLDLCDEYGLLVWEESVGWQNTVKDFLNHKFVQQTIDGTKRMMFHSINHPSVIVFGFLNEGYTSHEASIHVYETLTNLVKGNWGVAVHQSPAAASPPTETDPSSAVGTSTTSSNRMNDDAKSESALSILSSVRRLVSWASSSRFHDLNWKFADFLSFNSYEGWYPTTQPLTSLTLQEIPEIWDFSAAWAQDHYPGKPLICSETGAGGLYRVHGPSDGKKWSEEVQSVILQIHVLSLLNHEKIAGFALWQFTDSLIDQNISDTLHRPRGLNNKGVLTMHRKPKTSFFALRTIFKGEFTGLILPEADTGKFTDLIKVAS